MYKITLESESRFDYLNPFSSTWIIDNVHLIEKYNYTDTVNNIDYFLLSTMENPYKTIGYIVKTKGKTEVYWFTKTITNNIFERISSVFKRSNDTFVINTQSGVKVANIAFAKDILLKDKKTGEKIDVPGLLNIRIPEINSQLSSYFVHEAQNEKYEFGKVKQMTEQGSRSTFGIIEIKHFSPFVLFSIEDIKQTQVVSINTNTEIRDKVDNKEEEKDETPKTGTVDAVYFVVVITIISALGIVTVRKKMYN